MTFDEVLPFLESNHNAVAVTFRKSGSAQASVVFCGPYKGGIAFTTTGGRAKLANLLRDPRCTVLVSKSNWYGYVVVEGKAEVLGPDNTDPEDLRIALREIFKTAAGKDHPDWDDYDKVMVSERRSGITVRPDNVYGLAL